MFLEEPHRATRSYRRILERVGRDLFALGDKLEPYYVAALASYRLEYLFRNQLLAGEFRAARYEVLLTVRLLAIPSPLPRMNSNAIERGCSSLIEGMWNPVESERMFKQAAAIVLAVADGDLESAALRTEPFTDALKAAASRPARTRIHRRPLTP